MIGNARLSPVGRGTRLVGMAAVTTAAFLWSTNIFFGKLLVEALPPFTLSFLRQVVCLLVVLPFLIAGWGTARPMIVQQWPKLAVLGVLAFAIPHTFVYLALERTSAINVGLLNALLPAVALALALVLFRSSPTPWQVAGVVISGLGAAIIITAGDISRLLTLSVGKGEIVGLAAMTSTALYTVWIGSLRLIPRPSVLLAIGAAAGAMILFPLMLFELAFAPDILFTPPVVAGIVYVGIFPSAVAVIAWNRGIAILTSGIASQGVHLIPVFTVALAVAFLGEELMVFHVVAFCLVVGGIALARLRPA